jgi:nucleoside-diphosphate-sugar epimerase
MQPRLAAVTGATGFLGTVLVRALAERGWAVRILARREPLHPQWRGLEIEAIQGDLTSASALARLAEGAEVFIHNAGATKAANRERFMAVNRDGARAAAEAAGAAGARLLLVSSLAARRPELSAYAASKRAGEEAAAELTPEGRLTIVRPPALYGPGDREILPLFAAAARGAPLPLLGPPGGRIAMMHVEDAAAAIGQLLTAPAGVYALGGARPEGYSWREIAEAAVRATGGKSFPLQCPAWAAPLAGRGADLIAALTGKPAVFSSGKARELRHPDWGVAPEEAFPGLAPVRFDLDTGFVDTVAWARARGLIGLAPEAEQG